MSEFKLQSTREVAAGVLGPRSGFRLIVDGDYGPAQIDTVVRHLKVTWDTLAAERCDIDGDWAE